MKPFTIQWDWHDPLYLSANDFDSIPTIQNAMPTFAEEEEKS